MSARAWYHPTVQIDEKPVRLKVARLNVEESVEFKSEFNRSKKSQNRVKLHLSGSLTDEEFDKAMDREVELERRAKKFLASAITQYVSVDADQSSFVDEAGVPIQSGEDLVRVYGGRDDVLFSLLMTVFIENCVPEKAKNALRSAFDSSTTSVESTQTASGEKLEPTAKSVMQADSAQDEAATAKSESGPSGAVAH